MGTLVTWNLKDDYDIQLKRGYFHGSVDNVCAKFKLNLNNPDVALPSSRNFLANHLMIYEMRGRKL